MWRHPSDELASLLSRPESLSTASRPRGLGASADDGDCPHNASMSESADLTSPAEATSAASSRRSLSARIATGPRPRHLELSENADPAPAIAAISRPVRPVWTVRNLKLAHVVLGSVQPVPQLKEKPSC